MKRIELFFNMLYYCNYMILYKIGSGMDYLLFSIFDNRYTRKFCKSDSYWKYVNNLKRAHDSIMWSKRKKFPIYNVISTAYGATFLFIFIILFTILNMIEVITNIPIYKLIYENEAVAVIVGIIGALFLAHVTIDRWVDKNDKYISYFKKFSKQKFLKLFVWYVLSYGVVITCCYFSLMLIEF